MKPATRQYRQFTKSRVAAFALLGVALLGSAQASANAAQRPRESAAKPVTLTFWNWNPATPTLVSMFNKTHPGIRVVNVPKPGGSTGEYPDLLLAIKSHTTPDLAQIEYDVLPQFVATGAVEDLSKYGIGRYEKLFSPFALKQVTFGGQVYSVPQGDAPAGIYYNATEFKKYGLTVPTTWGQLATEAISFHKKHPSLYMADMPAGAKWLAMLGWEDGTSWFEVSHGAWKVNIASPTMIRIAKFLQPLINSGALPLEPSPDRASAAWYTNLSNGTILSLVAAQWEDGVLAEYNAKQSGQWRVALPPQWVAGGHSSAQYGGSTTAIFDTAKDPKAALTFAMWLVNNEAAVNYGATHGIGWPVEPRFDSVASLVGPQAFLGGQRSEPMWAASERDTGSQWNFGPDFLTLISYMNSLFPAVSSHKLSLVQLLQEAQAEQVKNLRTLGLKVTG